MKKLRSAGFVDNDDKEDDEESEEEDDEEEEYYESEKKKENSKIPVKNLFKKTAYVPPDMDDIDVAAENKDPKIRREKQEILFNLLKSYPDESQGQWNMSLPLFELKYEFHRREQHEKEQDQLILMKEAMKMILKGIEVLNEKFGPFLQLQGWSNNVTKDMKKFDRCLKALYLRYFRKTQVNPVMELFGLIVGSMILFHLESKFIGKPDTETRQKNSSSSSNRSSSSSSSSNSKINLGSLFRLFNK